MAQRTSPPFRADHVGSLLRPPRAAAGARGPHGRPDRRRRAARDRGRRDPRRREACRRTSACSRPPTASSAARRGTWTSSTSSAASRRRREQPERRVPQRRRRRSSSRPPRCTSTARSASSEHDLRRRLRVPEGASTTRHAEAHDPVAEHGPLPRRAGRDRRRRSTPTWTSFWDDLTTAYADQVAAARRARLHLPAVRRHQPRLPQRPEPARRDGRAGRRRRAPARALHPPHQRGARRTGPTGMARHHPHVPRQLPLARGWPRAATTSSPRRCSTSSTSTASSWSTTTRARAASSRCASCRQGKVVVLGLVTTKTGELETKDDAQAPHRRGVAVRRRRPALPLAAVRLLLDRRGQRADLRRAGRRSCA